MKMDSQKLRQIIERVKENPKLRRDAGIVALLGAVAFGIGVAFGVDFGAVFELAKTVIGILS